MQVSVCIAKTQMDLFIKTYRRLNTLLRSPIKFKQSSYHIFTYETFFTKLLRTFKAVNLSLFFGFLNTPTRVQVHPDHPYPCNKLDSTTEVLNWNNKTKTKSSTAGKPVEHGRVTGTRIIPSSYFTNGTDRVWTVRQISWVCDELTFN